MVSKLQNVSRTRWFIAAAIVVVSCFIPQMVQAASEAGGGSYSPPLYATFWSLVPPVVAIVLALVTKEVFSSLFLGIVVGAVFWASGANPGVYDDAGEAVWESTNIFTGTLNHLVRDGFLAQLTDSWNMGIIVFLIILGMLVAMMAKVGGSRAFGEWAARNIKTRRGAQGALMIFHLFIFIDDYFSCLTVGNVMRPVTDKARVSRAKLAYLIDATAAPVCILAPISTWAAAVASYVPEDGPGSEVDGFQMFINAIPFNFYAILSIIMIITLIVARFDYGPMAKFEYNAEMNGDLYTTPGRPYDGAEAETEQSGGNGKVIDLAMPIIILIISCVLSLIYTGGFFSPGSDAYLSFPSAFSDADAATGLVMGSLCAIVLIIIYYVAKKLIKLRELTDILPKGINAMASPCLILTFAWTLKAMTDTMGSSDFVREAMLSSAPGLASFLPAIIFLVACFIAFSTGTSWGTYGILVPIVCSVLSGGDPQLLVIGIAACLAGGVFGDHCSPISDTTIMASAGAQCDHIDHVNTQLPYAATVAAWSLVMYILSGFVRNAFIVLPIAIIGFLIILMIIRKTKGQIIGHDLIEKTKSAQA